MESLPYGRVETFLEQGVAQQELVIRRVGRFVFRVLKE